MGDTVNFDFDYITYVFQKLLKTVLQIVCFCDRIQCIQLSLSPVVVADLLRNDVYENILFRERSAVAVWRHARRSRKPFTSITLIIRHSEIFDIRKNYRSYRIINAYVRNAMCCKGVFSANVIPVGKNSELESVWIHRRSVQVVYFLFVRFRYRCRSAALTQYNNVVFVNTGRNIEEFTQRSMRLIIGVRWDIAAGFRMINVLIKKKMSGLKREGNGTSMTTTGRDTF